MKISDVTIITENNESKKISKLIEPCLSKHIKWNFNGATFDFSTDPTINELFAPILSPSAEELILLFKDSKKYAKPHNLVILDGYGAIRFHVAPPELISEPYQRYVEKMGVDVARRSIEFIQLDFSLNVGNNQLCVWIGFNYDWYEARSFDLKSGNFGSVLRAARW